VICAAVNSLVYSGVYRQIFECWWMSEAMPNKSVVNTASAPAN
jgi:hypothetical protein